MLPIAIPHRLAQLEHPFRQLIGAIYTAQYTGVRKLRIEAFNDGDQGTPFTFDVLASPYSEAELKAGLHLFKHLERCDFDIKVWSLNPTSASFGLQRTPALNVLLAASDKLRHLALRISGWESTGIMVNTFIHSSTSPSGLNPHGSMFNPWVSRNGGQSCDHWTSMELTAARKTIWISSPDTRIRRPLCPSGTAA
jgi:hypothetical protein